MAQILKDDDAKKANAIWSIIKAIIGLIMGFLAGAGVESTTSVLSNFLNH